MLVIMPVSLDVDISKPGFIKTPQKEISMPVGIPESIGHACYFWLFIRMPRRAALRKKEGVFFHE